MTYLRSWAVLALLFAAVTSTPAQGTAQQHDIVLDLVLPTGGTPQLRVADGGTGTVELPDVGSFGFVPTLQSDSKVVVVELFDLKAKPRQRLARLELTVAGGRVQSGTTPDFSIRVPRVITR